MMQDVSGVARERRVARLGINGDALVSLLSSHRIVEILMGFPDGAKFVGHTIDILTNNYVMFVEHPDFEPVPEGEEAPRMTVTLSNLNGKALEVFRRMEGNLK